jgi:hypothetical protein
MASPTYRYCEQKTKTGCEYCYAIDVTGKKTRVSRRVFMVNYNRPCTLEGKDETKKRGGDVAGRDEEEENGDDEKAVWNDLVTPTYSVPLHSKRGKGVRQTDDQDRPNQYDRKMATAELYQRVLADVHKSVTQTIDRDVRQTRAMSRHIAATHGAHPQS